MTDRAFQFLEINDLPQKPRSRGLTEIRGPYYTAIGERYLRDVMETMGAWVDSLKWAGGSFSLMPRDAVKKLNDTAHEFDALVSTGGFMEHVLTRGYAAVDSYIEEAKALGFDIIELSTGFISLPSGDWLNLIERVQKAGLKAKPEIGIQFGAGGDTPAEELESEGTQDVGWAVKQARRFVDAGVYMIMIESEGITENVTSWRTDVPAAFVDELGLEKVMFEAADPPVFQWYIKNYGPEVNLFVDHSQIVELSAIRAGIWGPNDLWGRVHTYRPGD
ncbi:MAG: phosphosulfolactate synthase [Gemmatimonadetes bacterium]|uniref:Phosphosulfolactate synthase n=1 Tax=Candidatus Kutchimonas denitrificans TaxID=3056748 RepID=A0AAE4ZAB7_9BACT|nr:phosphosulfolactate synthase [Gemmatimonadota bacterium]NIR76700.1 phosphosulfolactate synthase [Candidatus Kutchimonas denitrificans]NIS01187.1 phosphosulfolactate synthase [Gemmatimonadota bacterium]NIT68226.1 phosphosulfolactate synthase [Gemmatimonadota bacterium]NIW75444.1 phosphosulfolactate synthase [Gemmatimonadota bacterium]